MLKLEKGTHNQSITVSLRHEEPVLSSGFMQAFSLAIFLHVGGLFLFNIHLIHREDVLRVIEIPRTVDSDLGYSNRNTLGSAHIQGEGERYLTSRNRMNLQYSLPTTPQFMGSLVENRYNLEEELLAYQVPKKHQERTGYDPQSIEFPFVEEHTGVSVSISGPISRKKMLYDGLKDISSSKSSEGMVKLTYQIRIADQSGKVIWYSKEGDPTNSEKEKLAVKIIQAMLFEKAMGSLEQPLITAGIVEVMFD